jgi:hypothetical protein
MASNKHPKAQVGKNTPRDDLETNPGIGQSKGTRRTGEDPDLIEGNNTVEGDTGNDTTPQGGVRRERGRENK